MKLMEDKQKLKKEMKDKVSTEALEEELKDSRETIVKLQMELARFKVTWMHLYHIYIY